MSRLPSSPPANYATVVQFPRVWNIAYPELADPLTVTINVSGATSWEMRDLNGAVLASGAWTGVTQTIGTAGVAPFDKYGWYRLHLLGPDRADGQWTTDYGCCRLLVAQDRDPQIPRAPLRITNPPYQTDGLDAPALHAYCSLGGFRVSASAQNLQTQRQQNTASASAATSCTATLFGGGFDGAMTIASMAVVVHTVVGDNTGMGGPTDFPMSLAGTVTVGSGATKVTTNIYYRHAAITPSYRAAEPTFTCFTTNPAKHSVVVMEIGPSAANAAVLAFASNSGSGTSASITKDMTSIAGANEYGVIAGVSADQGTCTSDTGVPSVTPYFAVGQILNGSSDAYGGGFNHTDSYTLTGSPTNWTTVFAAFAGGTSYATSLATAKSLLDVRYNAWGQYVDPARPYRAVSIALLAQTSPQTVEHYLNEMTQLVADTFSYIPGFIGCYTSRNEPQGSYSMAENNAFCGAIYAGDASAVAAVPGYVNLGAILQPNFFGFCDAGMLDKGTGGANAMHYHDYNMAIDLANCLVVHRSLRKGLVQRSLDSLPVYMTEGSREMTWFPGGLGISLLGTMGTEYMMRSFVREVILRVPYERQYWYYDNRGGFDQVPTWQDDSGGLYPGPAMHRAFACELYGKNFEHELSFGDVYDNYVVGGVWRNATNHTAVAGIMAARGVPNLTMAFSGPLAGVPASVTVLDCWGNPTVIATTGRTFVVPVDIWPTYIRIPAGLDVAARPLNYGRSWLNIRTVTFADDGDAGASVTQMKKMVDQNYVNFYVGPGNDNDNYGSTYQTSALATTFPRNVSITTNFGEVIRADTVTCYAPMNWQSMGAILKGKLQYTLDGVTWLDPASPAASWDHSSTVSPKCYDFANDTLVDAYTLPQHYFEASLGGVLSIRGVRVVATIGSTGMYLDSNMSNPPGGITSSYPASVAFAEVSAFNRSAQGFPARR